MFQASWISAVGLAVEFCGLFFLFLDLLRSKAGTASFDKIRELQDNIEVSSRETIIRTHSGFQALVVFMRGYLSQLEIEAQESAEPANLPEVRDKDPKLAKVIEFIRGKGPVGLRRYAVEEFVSASNALLSKSDIEHALEVNKKTREALENLYLTKQAEA